MLVPGTAIEMYLYIMIISRKKNKGIGIEVVHFLGDGLFQTTEIS